MLRSMSRSHGKLVISAAIALMLVLGLASGSLAVARAETAVAKAPAARAGRPQVKDRSRYGPPKTSRELLGSRSRTGRQFINGDGSITAEYYGVPVNYPGGNGEYKPIDPSLEQTSHEGRVVSVNRASDFRVELPSRLGEGWVSLETSRARIALRPSRHEADEAYVDQESGSPTTSRSATERAYAGAFEGAAVEYESRTDGLKETIVVPTLPASRAFGFEMLVSGGLPRVGADGSIAVFGSGETTPSLRIPAPCMWDSAQTTTGPAFSSAVQYRLEPDGIGWHLSIVPDRAWLEDPRRVWPVRIDPGVIVVNGSPADTFVSSAYQGTNFSAHPLVWVNTNDPAANWTEYGFVQPGADLLGDLEAKIAAGYEPIAGRLNLRVSQVAVGGTVTASACDGDVDIPSVTWNDRPSVDPGAPTSQAGIASPGAWTTADISALLGYWQEQGIGMGTIRLSASVGAHAGFDSAERATAPIFAIDYVGRPTVVLGSPIEGQAVTGTPVASWQYAESLTGHPQASCLIRLSDPESGEVLAESSIRGSSTSAPIPQPSGGWTSGKAYAVDVMVASEPVAGRLVWSDIAEGGFELSLPDPVAEVSVETTASLRRFVEIDGNDDGLSDARNDSNESGRGSVRLAWDAVDGALGYDVYLSDGNDYNKVGSTEATSWTSAGKGIYPSDSRIAALDPNTSGSVLLSGQGLDLRDDPRPLYEKTAGIRLDGTTTYSFRVTARNENGSRSPTESVEVLVSLDERTDRLRGRSADTDVPLGDFFGDEASVRATHGAFMLKTTDLLLPSLGPDARVSRSYRSDEAGSGRLGRGWRFSFDVRVSSDATGATVTDEEGEQHRFAREGTQWRSSEGSQEVLQGDSVAGFALTRADASVLGFAPDGRLLSEADRNGNRIEYEWGDRSLTIKAPRDVWLIHERRIVVEFDAQNRISRAVLKTPGGQRAVDYGSSDDQASVVALPGSSAQKVRVYRYTGGVISAVAVPGFEPSKSREAVWAIRCEPSNGRVSVSNETGAGTPQMARTVACDTSAGIATISGATSTRTLKWDSSGRELSRTAENTTTAVEYAYDVAGNVIRTRSETGAVSRRAYDARGNVVVEIDAAGGTTMRRYSRNLCVWESDPRGSVTKRTFDVCGNLLSESTLLDVNGVTAVTKYSYYAAPDAGAVKTRSRLTATGPAVTEYTDYADCGEPRRVTEKAVVLEYRTTPRDLMTMSVYDEFGTLTSTYNPLGRLSLAVKYDDAGRPVRSTDASGTATETSYGVLGGVNESKRSNPATTACADWSTTDYNGAGLVVTETVRASDGATLSAAVHGYDAEGRQVSLDNNSVPGSERTTYDSQGNISQEWAEGSGTSATAATRSSYGPSGELMTQAAPGSANALDVTAYDAVGQLVRETTTDGVRRNFAYSTAGDLIGVESSTTAGTAVTTLTVDLVGRTTGQREAGEPTVTTSYDPLGNPVSVARAGQARSFEVRNSLGWVLTTVQPDGLETHNVFDMAGRAIAIKVVNGQTSTTTYDDCDRAVLQVNQDGTRVTTSYDVFGRVVSERHRNAAGQDLANIVTEYDRAGRVARETDSVFGRQRECTYDSTGTTTVESRRAGAARTRTVTDATGALRSIEATLAGRRLDLQVVAQDAGGRVTDVSSSALPGDRRVVFDEAGRQVRAWLPSGSGSVDSSVGAVYVYATEDGKRSRETLAFKLKGTEDSTYAYSVGGKLVSATTNGVSTRFAYAPITGALSQFRRGLESSVTITTDYLGRPTRAGSSVYAWDSLGRRSYSTTAIDSWSSYGWDGQRLTSIWNPTRYSATYLYDAHGQRLRSTVTSAGVTATTNWAYDGRRLQGYSTSASNGATWSVDYLYDPAGAPFAGVYRASDAAATPFSVRTNARGDVRELLDAEGRAFGFYSYDAYGAPREVVSASTGLVSSVLAARIVGRQPLRYAGYVWDSESRLYYVAERYYDPATASFLSRDPLQAPGDESAYLYCGGNPVDRTDPEGTIFLSLQDRVRYNRIRSRLLAAARQLVNWQVKYSSDAAHTQKPELRGQMDCSGAVAWVLRQADPWFAKRIPSPTSSRRWNTDSFVANLDWRTTYRGAARYAPGSPWKVGDVLVKGWVGNKMGHIVIVVREGTRPQVFECAASSGGGYASGARIVPLKDRVASWKPAYAGRLFAQEPNAPYGGIR